MFAVLDHSCLDAQFITRFPSGRFDALQEEEEAEEEAKAEAALAALADAAREQAKAPESPISPDFDPWEARETESTKWKNARRESPATDPSLAPSLLSGRDRKGGTTRKTSASSWEAPSPPASQALEKKSLLSIQYNCFASPYHVIRSRDFVLRSFITASKWPLTGP